MSEYKNKNTTKKSILYILQLLYKKTDEEHQVSTTDIMEYLNEEGITINRRTLSNDIEFLIEMGYDIVVVKSSPNRYFWGDREFEIPELRMLVDAVSSSRFITAKKSVELIDKLVTLAGDARAAEARKHIATSRRAKTDNREIYYIVDAITRAIRKKRKISFRYTEYDVHKEKVLRNNGEVYVCSPYVLYCNEDFYYVVGFGHKRRCIVSFRVDRLSNLEILEEPAVTEPENFDINDYANKIFKMFDGEEVVVELECENSLIKYIIDRYGMDFETEVKTPRTFIARIPVTLSPTFFSWVFQFSGGMMVRGPELAVEKYKEMLDRCRG